MKDDQAKRADKKRDAAEKLFSYIFLLRYGREPWVWEWIIGWALVSGQLVVMRPIEAQPLGAVHAAAYGVQQALGLAEQE